MGPIRREQPERTGRVERRSDSPRRIVCEQGQEEEMERVRRREDKRPEPRDDMGGLGAIGVIA